jgi:hydrogenase expression/formation protein HypC
VETYQENDMPMGRVEFGGVYKRVCLAHTPEAQPGQFVIVHVGFALQVIDQQEAEQVFKFLGQMNELEELRLEQE